MPKMGMCWFNTPDKFLINKPFVGPTNSFLQWYTERNVGLNLNLNIILLYHAMN